MNSWSTFRFPLQLEERLLPLPLLLLGRCRPLPGHLPLLVVLEEGSTVLAFAPLHPVTVYLEAEKTMITDISHYFGTCSYLEGIGVDHLPEHPH